MTPDDIGTCLLLIHSFQQCGEALRRLGDMFPSQRCNAVLMAANMAASYADRAALLCEDEIAAAEIAAVAKEELECA